MDEIQCLKVSVLVSSLIWNNLSPHGTFQGAAGSCQSRQALTFQAWTVDWDALLRAENERILNLNFI